MPKESVLSRNFKSIFSSQARYEIPFFQRGYAWDQKQWKKLLEDILDEGGILDNVDNGNFEDTEHFFGPIVVLEKIDGPPELKRFLIIDGQQRFTTTYLLLGTIKQLIEEKSAISTNAQTYLAELDKLLINNVNGEDDYLKLKIFSTKGDRLPTFKVIFKTNPNSPFLTEDQLLYDPNTNKIDAFLKFAKRQLKGVDVPKLWNICRAITESLKIVWIPLDEKKDDAQAIFESLNDAGMPLSASELLCNFIFRPLIDDENNNHEKIHNEKWLGARKEVGIDNFEEYLRNLFSIGEKKKVGKEKRMYAYFKIKNKNLSKEDALRTLEKITGFTKIFNQINKPKQYKHPDKKIAQLLYQIGETNMASVYPFLMAILKAEEIKSILTDQVAKIINEVYILLVRRKITGQSVTRYDSLFPSLLDRIIHEPNRIKAIHTEIQKEGLWVSDQEFDDAFLNKELYNSRELNFARHILQEIDKKMQNHGELPDYTTIDTIEHILPQTLNDHWKNYLKEEAFNINLKRITNTLGNLSLNSQPANSSFGQKPFLEKKEAYNLSSALARDVKARDEPWNMNSIQKRSKYLAVNALQIWKWNL